MNDNDKNNSGNGDFLKDSLVETRILREPHEVERRLAELGLTKKGLNRVGVVALGASADATAFHPANAAGTFAYQHGTWALRDEFVGEIWKVDTKNGVEAITNESISTSVIFTNVDLACNDYQAPKPRSRKGAGAERACIGNMFGFLPTFAHQQNDGRATYYYMLDANGAAELTRPVIKGSTFSAYVERIYLGNIGEPDDGLSKFDQDDTTVVLDPVVTRK